MVSTLPFGTMTLPLLLLLLPTNLFGSSAQEVSAATSLADMVEYLRAGDDRLVRPNPTSRTRERQSSEACSLHLEQAHEVVVAKKNHESEQDDDEKLLETQIDALRLIALCTTDHPENRAKLTAPVASAVVSFLSSASYSAKAAAAECVWISSFDSRRNYDAFLRAGVLEELVKLLVEEEDCGAVAPSITETTSSSSSNSNRMIINDCWESQMWAAAALQNLAATYCHSPTGRCHWEWVAERDSEDEEDSEDDDDDEDVMFEGRHLLTLLGDEDDEIKYDPKHVRLKLMRNPKLMERLESIICDNVKLLGEAPDRRTWPSRVTRVSSKNAPHTTPSIVAWAAIGLVKNLCLSPGFYERMSDELLSCLCEHAVKSPDWLEYTKAEHAIYYLGLEMEEVCEPLYRKEECSDYEDWKDYKGRSCEEYEEFRLCAEFGDAISPDLLQENKKTAQDEEVPASRSCCACGGGYRIEPDVEDSQDELLQDEKVDEPEL